MYRSCQASCCLIVIRSLVGVDIALERSFGNNNILKLLVCHPHKLLTKPTD